MFDQYFEYYAIILKGWVFFCGHAVCVADKQESFMLSNYLTLICMS